MYKQHVNIRYVTFAFGKSRVDPGSSTIMPCICLLPMLAPDYLRQSTLTRSLRLSMPRPQVRLPINGSGSYRVLLDCGLGNALAESLLGSEVGLSVTEPQSRTVAAVTRFRALTAANPKQYNLLPEGSRDHDSMLLPFDLTDSPMSLQSKHRSSLCTMHCPME